MQREVRNPTKASGQGDRAAPLPPWVSIPGPDVDEEPRELVDGVVGDPAPALVDPDLEAHAPSTHSHLGSAGARGRRVNTMLKIVGGCRIALL